MSASKLQKSGCYMSTPKNALVAVIKYANTKHLPKNSEES